MRHRNISFRNLPKGQRKLVKVNCAKKENFAFCTKKENSIFSVYEPIYMFWAQWNMQVLRPILIFFLIKRCKRGNYFFCLLDIVMSALGACSWEPCTEGVLSRTLSWQQRKMEGIQVSVREDTNHSWKWEAARFLFMWYSNFSSFLDTMQSEVLCSTSEGTPRRRWASDTSAASGKVQWHVGAGSHQPTVGISSQLWIQWHHSDSL